MKLKTVSLVLHTFERCTIFVVYKILLESVVLTDPGNNVIVFIISLKVLVTINKNREYKNEL